MGGGAPSAYSHLLLLFDASNFFFVFWWGGMVDFTNCYSFMSMNIVGDHYGLTSC